MDSFGQKMNQAVANRGVGLAEVARSTQVELSHLEALARGDYASLPEEERVRDILRSLADFLEVDREAVFQDYWLDRHGDVPAHARARWKRSLLPIALVVGAASIVGWWWFRWNEPAPRKTQAQVAPATPAAPPPAAAVAPRSAPQAPALPAVAPVQSIIEEARLGTGIVNRAVIGESDQFSEGTEVWFWTRVSGGKPGQTIHHVWLHDGQVSSDVALLIGASTWRTQSSKALRAGSAGSWAVEVRDDRGAVLARREFSCVPR
jgi:DUF2914 family protein/helix-turn-helix protein